QHGWLYLREPARLAYTPQYLSREPGWRIAYLGGLIAAIHDGHLGRSFGNRGSALALVESHTSSVHRADRTMVSPECGGLFLALGLRHRRGQHTIYLRRPTTRYISRHDLWPEVRNRSG